MCPHSHRLCPALGPKRPFSGTLAFWMITIIIKEDRPTLHYWTRLAIQCGHHCCRPWPRAWAVQTEGQLPQVRKGGRALGGGEGRTENNTPSCLLSQSSRPHSYNPHQLLETLPGLPGTGGGLTLPRRVRAWRPSAPSPGELGGWESSSPRVSVRSK